MNPTGVGEVEAPIGAPQLVQADCPATVVCTHGVPRALNITGVPDDWGVNPRVAADKLGLLPPLAPRRATAPRRTTTTGSPVSQLPFPLRSKNSCVLEVLVLTVEN